jgi:Fe-S-cluster containining protein
VSAASGRALESFAEWEFLDADHVKAWLDVNPIYIGYLGPDSRRLTLKARNGACTFHDSKRGCTLASKDRPTACRIYPFEPGGRLSVDRWETLEDARLNVARGTGHACLAVQESNSMSELQAAFGFEPHDIAHLADLMRAEVRAHARQERSNRPRSKRDR